MRNQHLKRDVSYPILSHFMSHFRQECSISTLAIWVGERQVSAGVRDGCADLERLKMFSRGITFG
jgi:hypothetical protein